MFSTILSTRPCFLGPGSHYGHWLILRVWQKHHSAIFLIDFLFSLAAFDGNFLIAHYIEILTQLRLEQRITAQEK